MPKDLLPIAGPYVLPYFVGIYADAVDKPLRVIVQRDLGELV